MRRDMLLVSLTVVGAGLCWWPEIIEPNLDLPVWLALVLVALCTGLTSLLSDHRWRFVVAAGVGSLAGLCSGMALWPPSDPIAASYGLFVIAAGAGASLVVSVSALLLAALLRNWGERHGVAVWIALVCAVAAGPLLLAATPPVVAYRVAHNDRLARERFLLLKDAVERAIAENGPGEAFCDGQVLRRFYTGPRFSDESWRYIVGNFVKQDGYMFGINCLGGRGVYTIDAMPARGKADGTLRLCTDQTKIVGCEEQSVDGQTRCVPCAP
jgi:hypothetical protein